MGVIGIITFVGIAFLLSKQRDKVQWPLVAWGLGLQFLAGLLILKTSPGRMIFEWAQSAVSKVQDFAMAGGSMVFGPLANQDLMANAFNPENTFVFAVTVTSVIIVVSSISHLLYHWGILPRVVQAMAYLMKKTMRTSGSESLAVAANIFAGQTEAPILVRPYIKGMTMSELLCLMTGGMATIAGSVLIIYVGLGVEAGHLLTASVMSAPASVMIAKLMFPETSTSQTAAGADVHIEKTAINAIDALCNGATEGMRLAINVIAMLIAFSAAIAMANYFLGLVTPTSWALTIQKLLGWMNAPFAFLMGIPWTDCVTIGQALGERIALNEFIGYLSLQGVRDSLDPRSTAIASYALCGFANFASIAIQIGGIGALAPERRSDLAKLGLKSMVGGVLACYTTAAMAGLLL